MNVHRHAPAVLLIPPERPVTRARRRNRVQRSCFASLSLRAASYSLALLALSLLPQSLSLDFSFIRSLAPLLCVFVLIRRVYRVAHSTCIRIAGLLPNTDRHSICLSVPLQIRVESRRAHRPRWWRVRSVSLVRWGTHNAAGRCFRCRKYAIARVGLTLITRRQAAEINGCGMPCNM